MDDTKGMHTRNPCCGELQRPPFSFTFKFYFIWKLTKFIILIFKRYGTIAEMHKYNIHLEITYNKIDMTLYENSHTLYINLRFGHSSPSHFSLETGEPYWETVHGVHDETGFHYRQFLQNHLHYKCFEKNFHKLFSYTAPKVPARPPSPRWNASSG